MNWKKQITSKQIVRSRYWAGYAWAISKDQGANPRPILCVIRGDQEDKPPASSLNWTEKSLLLTRSVITGPTLIFVKWFVECRPENNAEHWKKITPRSITRYVTRIYEGESIIIRSAVAYVFLLAALSFSRASLGVVFFLSQLCKFEVATSVPLSQPWR